MDLSAVDFAGMTPDELSVLGTESTPLPSAPESQAGQEGSLSEKYSADSGDLNYIGDQIRTVEELLKHANVDLSVWEVSESKINRWEVAGKRHHGQNEQGKWQAESLWKTPLLQISVKLKRKIPKSVHDALREILSDVPVWRGELPSVSRRDLKSESHLLELSLYDAHLGKVAWGAETGTNYDLSIASSDYVGAVEDMLAKVSGYNIDKIIIPLGHDFFQADNWISTTHKGTLVDSTDDRFAKVFRCGYEIVQQTVMRCREVADVEVLWIPGNHDRTTSWYLSEMLRAVHEGDDRVKVDVTPRRRKYRLYGITLIGYDHGETIPAKDLPNMFMVEAAELLAQSVYRTWRIGHYHKNKKTRWVDNDTIAGVDVTVLPSLSGTDAWHFENGFVGNMRAAVASLWSRETGPAGTFPVEARSAVEARKYRPSDVITLGQVI